MKIHYENLSNMRTGFNIAIIILLLFVFSGLTTKIYGQPINILVLDDLRFGEFYPSAGGGNITISATGNIRTSGVVHLGGAVSAARFSVRTTGKNRLITVTILNPVVTLNRAGGGGQMTLNVGTVSPDSYMHPKGNHTQIVSVGGSLAVGSITSNPPGNYSGTFTITVNSQ